MTISLRARKREAPAGGGRPPTEAAAHFVLPLVEYLPQSRRLLEQLVPDMKIGPYELRERIGIGGMGVVYRAQDRLAGEEVAMKFLISSDQEKNAIALQAFEQEAEVIRALDHPAIVEVRELNRQDSFDYMVMELYLGPYGRPVNLADYSRDFGPATGLLVEEDLQQIFLALLGAIGYAHEHDVVHCDLKPGNILLQCQEAADDFWLATLKLTDFGLAKVIGEGVVHESVTQSMDRVTQGAALTEDVSALVGTYEYMSPEQRRREPATSQSDLYAVGMMMYRLFTGKQELGLRPPSELRPGVDRGWDRIILTALREKPEQRYATAADMAADIAALRL